MIGVGWGEITDDDLEGLKRIVLIQAHLKILRRRVISKKHSAPFDVKDTIRRAARDRGEHTAVSAWETRAAAETKICAHVLPQSEDGVVVWSNIWRRRQTGCDEATRLIWNDKVKASIGAHVHRDKALTVQLERERQCHHGVAIVAMAASVGVTWHNGIGPIGDCVLISRARCRCRLWDTCSQHLCARNSKANRTVIAACGIDVGANRCPRCECTKYVHVGRGSPFISVWKVHVCAVGSGRDLDFGSGFRRCGGSFKLLSGESSL